MQRSEVAGHMGRQLLNGHNMILITGASRNIGRYLFDHYSKIERVYGTYMSTKPTFSAPLDRYYYVDVSDYSSVSSFIGTIEKEINEITLINCAGVSYNSFAHKSNPKEWKRVIEINLIGTYHMMRAVLPLMRKQRYGRIINLSSVVAQKPTPGVSAYAASKSALWGLTRSVAQENGSLGITVNNINLGYVNLGMGVEQVPEAYQTVIKSQIPSNEFCDPREILQTIEYLRKTSYVNGTSIDLNGGLI